MFNWRITKYNPKYRDAYGGFLRDDWTSMSQIGTVCEGEIVTTKDYFKVEDAYIKAIIYIMDFLKITSLYVTYFEKYTVVPDEDVLSSKSMVEVYKKLTVGLQVNKQEITDIARLILRESLFCRLESENMFVHCSSDYYMFIGGVQTPPMNIIAKIEKLGLFIEECESPYFPEPEDMN